MNRSELLRACAAYDGKNPDPLERAAMACAEEAWVGDTVFDAAVTRDRHRTRIGATWKLVHRFGPSARRRH